MSFLSIRNEDGSPRLWSVGTLTYTSGAVAILFCWLLWGDFAWSLKERAAGSVATLMIKSLGVSDFFYGVIILAIPNLTNVILGPIVSYRSDRYRGRWGRRIPYLMLTTPFVAVGMIGLGCTPWLGRLLYDAVGPDVISYHSAAMAVFCVFWLMLDFGTTLANVIFVALVNDVVPSVFLGRFFGLFRAVSLGAGIIFNYYLFGIAEAHYFEIFGLLGLIYAVGFIMVCFKVKEGQYPPVELTEKPTAGFWEAAQKYVKECFGHPFYRWVIFAYVICGLANIPFNSYAIFYAKSLGVGMDAVGKYLAITFMISLVLSYFLGMLADKFHPIRVGMAAIFVYGLVTLAGMVLIRGQLSFAVVMIAHGVVTGSFMTLTASYGQRLFPRQLFAQFNSAMTVFTSLSWVLTSLAVGAMLDLTGNHYEYVWCLGSFFAFAGVAMMMVVYRKFIRLGGDVNYRPPVEYME